MNTQAKIETIEQEINVIKTQLQSAKELIILREYDSFFDRIKQSKEFTFEGKIQALAKLTINYTLTLGSVKVYLNNVILTELKPQENIECLTVGLLKGDNKITFDLSSSEELKINKIEIFGYAQEKTLNSNISSFEFGEGAFLGIYNGASRTVQIQYVSGENAVSVEYFELVKLFAMSKLEDKDKAILLVCSDTVFTAYILDLQTKQIITNKTYIGSFKSICGIKSGCFLVIESDGSLQKYIFNENLEYSCETLGLFAKKVISKPSVNSYIVIDLADKASLYQ